MRYEIRFWPYGSNPHESMPYDEVVEVEGKMPAVVRALKEAVRRKSREKGDKLTGYLFKRDTSGKARYVKVAFFKERYGGHGTMRVVTLKNPYRAAGDPAVYSMNVDRKFGRGY